MSSWFPPTNPAKPAVYPNISPQYIQANKPPSQAVRGTVNRTPAPVQYSPSWYNTCVATMTFTIEIEREEDGRWIAEVPALAGVLCYGESRDAAVARVQALALRVIAERLEHGEAPAELLNVSFEAA